MTLQGGGAVKFDEAGLIIDEAGRPLQFLVGEPRHDDDDEEHQDGDDDGY